MANPTSEANGTQSATVTTEHVLRDVATAGTFQLVVDLANMVAGDVTELRCYQTVLSSGTKRQIAFQQFCGAQPAHELVAVGPMLANLNTDSASLEFSLKQTFGTTRNYAWQVYKYS